MFEVAFLSLSARHHPILFANNYREVCGLGKIVFLDSSAITRFWAEGQARNGSVETNDEQDALPRTATWLIFTQAHPQPYAVNERKEPGEAEKGSATGLIFHRRIAKDLKAAVYPLLIEFLFSIGTSADESEPRDICRLK